jgi:hypothetical protein
VAPLQQGHTLFNWLLTFRGLSWISVSAPTVMPLILAPSGATQQHREKHVDHSGIHNLSQQHTPVAVSLQVTPDHSKQHPASYLVDKQCQTIVHAKWMTVETIQ